MLINVIIVIREHDELVSARPCCPIWKRGASHGGPFIFSLYLESFTIFYLREQAGSSFSAVLPLGAGALDAP